MKTSATCNERRLGEMMRDSPKAKGGGDQKSDHRVFRYPGDQITLAEAGPSPRARGSREFEGQDLAHVALRQAIALGAVVQHWHAVAAAGLDALGGVADPRQAIACGA